METIFVREVTLRYRTPEHKQKTLVAIREPEDVAAFVRGVLPDNVREHFIALFLDSAHNIVAYSVVSTGTANQSLVHIREVFQPALIAGACGLAVAHNHPSNNKAPSIEDGKVTKGIKEASELLGIPFLDHVIVTEADYYSYKSEGRL